MTKKITVLTSASVGWATEAVRFLIQNANVYRVQFQPPKKNNDSVDNIQNKVIDTNCFQKICSEYSIQLVGANSCNTSHFRDYLIKEKIDYVICLGYGEILKKDLLLTEEVCFINFHPSVLPYHKGSNPISSVIMYNEKSTGVTVHNMTEIVDEGDIYFQEKISIDPDDTFSTLSAKLSLVAESLMSELVSEIMSGSINKVGIKISDKGFYVNRKDDSFFKVNILEENLDAIDRKIRAYGEISHISFILENNKIYVKQAKLLTVKKDKGKRIIIPWLDNNLKIIEGNFLLILSGLTINDKEIDFHNDFLIKKLLLEKTGWQ